MNCLIKHLVYGIAFFVFQAGEGRLMTPSKTVFIKNVFGLSSH